MALCYLITVLLALCGVVYAGFSQPSLLAFVYIAISASPLAIFSIGLIQPEHPRRLDSGWMSFFRCAFLLLAVLNVVVLIHGHGFSLSDVLTRQGLFEIAGKATIERYTLGTTEGSPILVAATFVSAFLWASSSLPSLAALLIGLAPAAAYSVLSTEKWPFYCVISFFITGVLASHRQGRTTSAYTTDIAIPVVAMAIGVGLLSLVTRAGDDDTLPLSQVIASFSGTIIHYFFAQYEAFGMWLSSHYLDCCSGGRRTFTGPMSLLGLDTREQGVFTDTVVVQGIETNIYTAWRYLAEDFSIIGPIIIVLTYAVLYRWCVLRQAHRCSAALLTLLGVTTFLQVNTTIFVHNSVTLAAFICAAVSAATSAPHHKARNELI